MTMSVLIPAFNEADRIGETVAALLPMKLKYTDFEIIVVDDGSSDDTLRVAREAGADVVHRQNNAGKGAALTAAFNISRGEILILLDADLKDTAAECEKLALPILHNEADMTIALFTRSSGTGGGVGLAVKLARWGIFKLTGRIMQAPLSGQRAFKRPLLMKTGGFASGWGVEVSLTVRTLKAGYRLLEVPTTMSHRVTGKTFDGVRHRAFQFLGILQTLVKLAINK